MFVVCQTSLAATVPVSTLLAQAWRPLIAALLMGLAVAETRWAGLVGQIGIGAVTYAAALVITRALSREEWTVLRGVLATFRPSRSARLAQRQA